MSYQEFYKYRGHPFANELYKRAKNIIHFLYFWYPINKNFALFRTQLKIIRNLLSLEEGIAWHKKEIKKLRREASTLAINSKSNLTDQLKNEISEKYDEANELEFQKKILGYFRWIFRYVADGIAWRAFGYNREIIRALSDKQPVPVFSNEGGINNVINVFKALRKLGKEWLPVMHDLTNCLRTADFTISKNGQIYRIFELKIRKTKEGKDQLKKLQNKREIRQKNRLEDVFDFFETGDLGKLRKELAGGKSIKSRKPEIYNFKYIEKAIRLARIKGYGFQEPENGILYIAGNSKLLTEFDILQKAVEQYPHIFNTPPTFRSFGPRDDETPSLLPLTAMNLRYRTVVDLLFGDIYVITFLNYRCLVENANKAGIPLSVNNDLGYFRMSVKTDPEGEVGEGLFDRLLKEGLSMKSFFDLIKGIMTIYEMNKISFYYSLNSKFVKFLIKNKLLLISLKKRTPFILVNQSIKSFYRSRSYHNDAIPKSYFLHNSGLKQIKEYLYKKCGNNAIRIEINRINKPPL
jgi:hypothetical protein